MMVFWSLVETEYHSTISGCCHTSFFASGMFACCPKSQAGAALFVWLTVNKQSWCSDWSFNSSVAGSFVESVCTPRLLYASRALACYPKSHWGVIPPLSGSVRESNEMISLFYGSIVQIHLKHKVPLQRWHAIQNHKLGKQYSDSLLKSNVGTVTGLSYDSKNTRCRCCLIHRSLFCFTSEYGGILSKILHSNMV